MTNEHVTPFKHIIISKPLKVETFQFWQFQLSFIQKGTEHIRLLTFKAATKLSQIGWVQKLVIEVAKQNGVLYS